ncbi:Putative extracellular membrane protein, CFEM [Colletotrichum destructivum]|uniref:Extracellular membrane protein, CFEM n=1 Tax=Colletotrichum destructivum TaxID=34406 RepID=A0AAX4IYR8_9PEZI|nr:Putative extracellular membrane protein, CFEM [Colletotrichum destructivum]
MQAGGILLLIVAAAARAAAHPDPDPIPIPIPASVSSSTSPTIQLSTIPTCAMQCLVDGFHAGNCTMAALAGCMCTNVPLLAHISECVQKSCDIFADQVATARISQNLCKAYPKQERRRFSKIFAIGLPLITTLVVALRCVARLQVASRLWWDDWTALMALGFLIVMSGLGLANSNLGFGYHYWDIDPGNGKMILQIFYAQQLLYIFVQVFAKASISCFYSRVFTNKRFQLAIKCFLVFLFSHGLMFLLLLAFQCVPVRSIWDRSINGRCFDTAAISYGGAACSILEDFILILMPLPELLKLKLSKRKKSALVFMFGIGSFACIASMVRLKYLVTFVHSFDVTWDNVNLVVWSSIELNLAIICGSLPALRSLFKKIPALLKTVKSSAEGEKSRADQRRQSATVIAMSDASDNSNGQSSKGNTPRRVGMPRPFGSASTACGKSFHLSRDKETDPDSKEEFGPGDLETGR